MGFSDKNYRLIDHTADFGIHVFGDDLTALFANAALATIEQITDIKKIKASRTINISADGRDWADLMINWLREVLYCWNGYELLPGGVDIEKIFPHRIEARIGVEPFDPDRHFIRQEIKAVTYHQIRVDKVSEGWEARIIFDV